VWCDVGFVSDPETHQELQRTHKRPYTCTALTCNNRRRRVICIEGTGFRRCNRKPAQFVEWPDLMLSYDPIVAGDFPAGTIPHQGQFPRRDISPLRLFPTRSFTRQDISPLRLFPAYSFPRWTFPRRGLFPAIHFPRGERI